MLRDSLFEYNKNVCFRFFLNFSIIESIFFLLRMLFFFLQLYIVGYSVNDVIHCRQHATCML